MKANSKWYVVWKGRRTGVFTTWEECAAQVSGFPGAQYKSFESRADAENAFRGQYDDYKRPPSPKSAEKPSGKNTDLPPGITPPISDSYVVDAACSGNPGPVEYRGVHLLTGNEFFREGPFPNGSNNIGEFLAIVHALALLRAEGIRSPVYSDSHNAIRWVQEKRCKTTLVRNETNAELFRRIARAEQWLAENAYANPLLKWETDDWGENPADFGRK